MSILLVVDIGLSTGHIYSVMPGISLMNPLTFAISVLANLPSVRKARTEQVDMLQNPAIHRSSSKCETWHQS